jgi:hypothetical protein
MNVFLNSWKLELITQKWNLMCCCSWFYAHMIFEQIRGWVLSAKPFFSWIGTLAWCAWAVAAVLGLLYVVQEIRLILRLKLSWTLLLFDEPAEASCDRPGTYIFVRRKDRLFDQNWGRVPLCKTVWPNFVTSEKRYWFYVLCILCPFLWLGCIFFFNFWWGFTYFSPKYSSRPFMST